jgi:2,3-dihydroxybenzoate-AMP ligase
MSASLTTSLTSAQQSIWMGHQFDPLSPAYNVASYIEISGSIDQQRLQRALQKAVDEIEALRARFHEHDDAGISGLTQTVMAEATVDLPLFDLTGNGAPQTAARAWMDNDVAQPTDLVNGPLFTSALLQVAPQVSYWYFKTHHIAMDGVALSMLFKRVAELYGQTPGQSSSSPFGSLRQVLENEQSWRASPAFEVDREFWRQHCQDMGEVTSFSSEVAQPSHQAIHYRQSLNDQVLARLRERADALGSHWVNLLLAAFGAFVGRSTGYRKVVIGLPMMNRSDTGAANVPCTQANVLPLRLDINPGESVEQLLAAVEAQLTGLRAHQRYRAEDIRRDCNLLGENRRLTGPQINIDFFSAALSFGGIPGQVHVLSAGPADDLSLLIQTRPDGNALNIIAMANPALYSHETLQRHVQRFVRFVERFAAASDTALGLLDAYDEEDPGFAQSNACFAPEGDSKTPSVTLVERFEQAVQATPDALALTLNGEHLSYRELNERANRLAHLIRSEVGQVGSQPIALLLARSVNTIVCILGVLKTGAYYVPLDPDAPAERIETILDDTRPALVICDQASRDLLATACSPVLPIDGPSTLNRLQEHAASNLDQGPRAEDLAYVIYTSGSTGKPKGVCITHHNVVRLFSSTHHWFDYRNTDVWSGCHGYIFDASVWEMWGALLHGARLVLVPVATTREPEKLLELVVREQVTVFGQIPSAFYRFMEAEADRPDLSGQLNLRYQCFGGEALDLSRLKPWFERHADSRTRLLNLYGITETTINATYQFITREQVLANNGSLIGTVYDDLDIKVLDDALRPVPVGSYGEMYVRGAGLARGYLNRRDLDATRFVADPFGAPGARMYRSGDVAALLDGGVLEYIGRADQQVKVRGYRIELGEIETHLRGHPALSDAIALVITDASDDPKLVAHVVPNASSTCEDIDTSVLRDYLRDRLPSYMVPSAIGVLERLPVTLTGKVDRKALPAIALSSSRQIEPSRDELDERVLANWSAQLEIETLSIDDNFFDIGGDSIKAIRICRDLGLPVTELFERPTPRACADYLRDHADRDGADVIRWLHEFDKAADKDRLNLVCVPFAGGNAFAYRNLVNQLANVFTCVSVNLPGHDIMRPDEAMQDLEAVAAGAVEEILARLNGPIVVYGHCAGNAIAIEIARRLEQGGADLKALVIGGMLLDQDPVEVRANVSGQSGESIIDFLRQIGGFKEALDEASMASIARMTKHDATQTARFFAEELQDRQRLQAPIHVIVGNEDPLTPDFDTRYKDWAIYNPNVTLSVIEGGGHYFVTDLAAPLADVLREHYQHLNPATPPRAIRTLRAFHNPFDELQGSFFLLANDAGQLSLWPEFAPSPAGWNKVFGPASHAECLEQTQAADAVMATEPPPPTEGLDAPYWPLEFEARYRASGWWTGETLGAILTRHALLDPQRVAVTEGERHLSYSQLDTNADRIADGFATLGLKAGDRVVVQLPNTIEFIETIFGLFRLGAIPVFALPSDRLNEITHIFEISGAVAYVIKDQALGFDYRRIATDIASTVTSLKHVIVVGDAEGFIPFAKLFGRTAAWPQRSSREPALITLSGGSTALPKLILRRHDDYLYSFKASAEICQLDAHSVYLCALPAGHNFTLSSPGFLGVLYAGGRVVMTSDPSGSAAFALIERERVTLTSLVPSLAQSWLHAPRHHDLSSLRLLQVGGARLSDDVAERLAAAFDCQLQQVYGMSEGLVCYTGLGDTDEHVLQTQGLPISSDDEILIVDENDQPVADGVPGQLLVRGPYTIRGYLNAPEHNVRAFTCDGFYRTGDVVMRRADGYLVVTGRIKDQVNRGGEKIAAEEIEGYLLAHPGVLEAAIIGMPDEYLGEVSCAVVVLAPGADVAPNTLKSFVRQQGVAAFKVPDQVRLVPSLPKTTLGKIDKNVLRTLLSQ